MAVIHRKKVFKKITEDTMNSARGKKKKSLVGWTKENWVMEFLYSHSVSELLFFPTTYSTKEKRYNKKVRITIEEI